MTLVEYAALHLGHERVSALRGPGVGSPFSREYVCGTAVSVRDGRVEFGVDPVASSAARSPTTFVDDLHMLVGDTVVDVHDIMNGMLTCVVYGPDRREAVDDSDLDVVEIACPTHWGASRRAKIRQAALPLAREVVLVDVAAAAAGCAGERVPPRVMIVEPGPFDTTISLVYTSADVTRTQVLRRLATGTADITADADAVAIIVVAVKDSTPFGVEDVYIVETDVGTADMVAALTAADMTVRTVSGLDIARALTTRAGISIEPGVPLGAQYETEPPGHPTDAVGSVARMPARSAAWLDEEHIEGGRSSRRTPALAAGLIGAAIVAIAGLVVAIRTEAPVATTQSQVAAVVQEEGRDPSVPPLSTTELPTTSVKHTVSLPASSASSVSLPPSASTDEPVPVSFGRVTIQVPSSWRVTDEGERLVLVPAELPDRRIVVTTADLLDGATIADVARDLEREIGARGPTPGGSPRFEQFERAADFGGRVGISYVEVPDTESVVLWRVLVDGGQQVSIGCQGEPDAVALVERECTRAVSTVVVAPMT